MASVQKRTPRKAAKTKDKDPFAVAFGYRLYLAQQAKNLSNVKLARALRAKRGTNTVQTRTIGEYLAGDRLPVADTLAILAEALDVSADWLLFGEAYPRERTARTAIGALGDELKEHLWQVLLASGRKRRPLPFDTVRSVLPSGPAALKAVERVARSYVQFIAGRRARDAWQLLATALSDMEGTSYGASERERAELLAARQHAQGMAHVVTRDGAASHGLSPWRAISARLEDGRWVATMAYYGAGVWLEECGFVGAVPLAFNGAGSLLANGATEQIMRLSATRPRSNRELAEDAAKRALRAQAAD